MLKFIATLSTAFLLIFSGCKSDSRTGADETADSTAATVSDTGTAVQTGMETAGTPGAQIYVDPKGRTVLPTNPALKPGHPDYGKVYSTPKGVVIRGKYIGGARGEIIIDQLGIGMNIKPLYSQVVNVKDEFGFDVMADGPQLLQLRLPNGNIHLIARPGDSMYFEIRFDNPGHFSLTGSPETLQLRDMYDIISEANNKKQVVLDRTKSLDEQLREAETEEQKRRLRGELRSQYELQPVMLTQYDDEKQENLKKFIKKVDTSFAGLLASLYLDPEKHLDFLVKMDEVYMKRYSSTVFAQSLHNKVSIYTPLMKGKIAPEIRLETPEGRTIKLSDYRGKYVLIDFWASWCGPCRRENPNVKRMYDKYKDKGFTVFGVSLDKDRAAWTKAIKDDGLTWPQASDLLFQESAAAQTYMVKNIPTSYLLDKDGRILAKDLRGDALEKKLKEIFKQ